MTSFRELRAAIRKRLDGEQSKDQVHSEKFDAASPVTDSDGLLASVAAQISEAPPALTSVKPVDAVNPLAEVVDREHHDNPEQRHHKRLLRRQMRKDFQSLLTEDPLPPEKAYTEFYILYAEHPTLLREILQEFSQHQIGTQVALVQDLLERNVTADTLEDFLAKRRHREERRVLLTTLPRVVVIHVLATPEGPPPEQFARRRVQSAIAHLLLGVPLDGISLIGDYPARVGEYPVTIDLGEGIECTSSIRFELFQDGLPSDCAELENLKGIAVGIHEDPAVAIQRCLVHTPEEDPRAYYLRLSNGLITAYRLGYWQSSWVQDAIRKWRATQPEEAVVLAPSESRTDQPGTSKRPDMTQVAASPSHEARVPDASLAKEQTTASVEVTPRLSLVTHQVAHLGEETRIVLEVDTPGSVDDPRLEILPVPGQYEVNPRHCVYRLAGVGRQTTRQMEVSICPMTKPGESVRLSAVLYYKTAEGEDKEARLVENGCYVKLSPETEFRPVVPPYDISHPATDLFYGRQRLLHQMADNLGTAASSGTSMIVYGLTRAGKTSVVRRFIAQTLSQRGLDHLYIPIYINFQRIDKVDLRSDGDFLYVLIRSILEGLAEQPGVVLPALYPEHYREGFQARPYLTFDRFLQEVLQLLGNRRLLLVLDEFSYLYGLMKPLSGDNGLTSQMFGFLSSEVQSTARLVFIFTGTYFLREMMNTYAYDLAKICFPRLVSYLDEASARQLVVEPVRRRVTSPQDGWLEYDALAVDRIVEVTNCHPFLIQYLCSYLVDRMNNIKRVQVTLADVETVIEELISDSAYDNALVSLWNELNELQHKVMWAIATADGHRGDEQIGFHAIADTLSRLGDQAAPEEIRNMCAQLVKAELLYETVSGITTAYRITVPLYRMWLQTPQSVMASAGI